MKNYNELEYSEREEIKVLFANWLKHYSHEVIVSVFEKRDEIINNEHTMNLLKELCRRDRMEADDFENTIDMLFRNYDDFKEFDPHNHSLTHAGSYRDILYDMYIK